MRLARLPDCHLSYCTNIHPGENWSDVDRALRTYLPGVKQSVSPEQAMGVGLRLSALAACELAENDERLQTFKRWLEQEDLYVYTVNGFPYGAFHGQRVKENVYRPDWAEPKRLNYTRQLALILSRLLPERQHGTISTVPVGFKPDFADSRRLRLAVDHLLQLVAFLTELEHETGRLIQCALEPEPGCCLETTGESVAFFQRHLLSDQALEQLARYLPADLGRNADVSVIKEHLGICLDTCHAAVMFERPVLMLETLMEASIPVHKVQLTAALSVERLTPAARDQLRGFADAVYLHQTSVRGNNRTRRWPSRFYLDLPEALDEADEGARLRSHFHVPVFERNLGDLATTQEDLIELLDAFRRDPCCSHLEVETYTFGVLPEALREGSVVANVSRELNWVKERLGS